MDELGPATLGEEAMRLDERRFRVVAIIAALVALPFVLVHVIITLTVMPQLASFSAEMGGTLPGAVELTLTLSRNGLLSLIFVVVDVAIFALMYRLAKKYWIGLLFVPVVAYLAISSLLVPLLYMPLFSSITQIQ
ncbi:MAG: hypothetical protein KGZ40_09625 [Clostridiales bacterium]|nr:hypothetical protein [Clostridiales bacterium]